MGATDRVNLGANFAFRQPIRFKGVQIIDLLRPAARKKPTMSEACQYLARVRFCTKNYTNHEINVSLFDGELRRIEIVTVIVRASGLSVFDKPETGIDPRSSQDLAQVSGRMR